VFRADLFHVRDGAVVGELEVAEADEILAAGGQREGQGEDEVRMAAQSNSAADTMEWCPETAAGPLLEQCKKKWFCYRAMRTGTVALVLCALAIAACKKPSDQQQSGQEAPPPPRRPLPGS